MQRRKFIKSPGLVAVGIGVFGNVSWSRDEFIGENPTSTDMLGPFYRPGAPFRKWNGQILEGLSYKENNEFTGGINKTSISTRFELQPTGEVKLTFYYDHPISRKK